MVFKSLFEGGKKNKEETKYTLRKTEHCTVAINIKEDGRKFFFVVPRSRTRDNGHKLEHRTVLPGNIREQFCAVWVMEHQHRGLILRDFRKLPGQEPEPHWRRLKTEAFPMKVIYYIT